jgi:glyoxylase-like metal-dependent hydrolase (beta-lactamase superfamily II)
MQTLERLRALDARIILPGHGPVITRPDTKITEYLTHRRERERQLLEALGTGPATVGELVAAMYHDTDPRLRDLAEGSVLAQLEKLTRESRVQRQGERYQLRQ